MSIPRDLGQVLFVGVGILFMFVVVVPHRYIYSYRDGYAGDLINLVQVLPALICSGLLLVSIVESNFKKRVSLSDPVLVTMLLWTGLVTLSGAGSERPSYAFLRDIYYTLTGISLALVARRAFVARARAAVWILVTPTALVGVYCVLEFATTTRFLWSDVFSLSNARYARFASDDFGNRVVGTVGHPVYLGSLLVLVLPLSLWASSHMRSGARFLAGLSTLGILSGLLLTFSRGAWLGVAAGCLFYFRGRSSKQLWIVSLVGCMILSAAFSVDRVWTTLSSRRTLGQIEKFKTDQRGVAYGQATAMLNASPLLGLGTGLYRHVGRRIGDSNDTPDNMYLRLVVEHGLAGVSAGGAMMVTILATINGGGRRSFGSRGRVAETDLNRAIVASIVGFLVDMITCDALYFSTTRISFWIVVGLGLSRSVSSEDEHPVVT